MVDNKGTFNNRVFQIGITSLGRTKHTMHMQAPQAARGGVVGVWCDCTQV